MSERARRSEKSSDLAKRFVRFGARVGKLVEDLPNTRLGKHLASQLIRSGTAAAPNYAEACGSESRKDFIHKLGVCEKELRESQCWIDLIVEADLLVDD